MKQEGIEVVVAIQTHVFRISLRNSATCTTNPRRHWPHARCQGFLAVQIRKQMLGPQTNLTLAPLVRQLPGSIASHRSVALSAQPATCLQ
jgi:hypothetical protein